MSDFQRIGLAVCRPLSYNRWYDGPNPDRRYEYGIYALRSAYGQTIDPPALYVRYEGYREGPLRVGLPLAGVHASWNQPLREFNPRVYDTVTFFEAA